MSRPAPSTRADYRFFHAMATRWLDCDMYGHVNNAVYYLYFDTTVVLFEIQCGGIDMVSGSRICFVAETRCRYHRPITFPDAIDVGLRVVGLGATSLRYELGVFRQGDELASAEGYFVHVMVDRADFRPAPIPDEVRAALQPYIWTGSEHG